MIVQIKRYPKSSKSELWRRVQGVLLAGLMMSGSAFVVLADGKEETERARKAAKVLSDIMKAPDKGIPGDLLKQAHAIAVIPHVVKGAFGVGGRFGKGLVSRKTAAGGWGTPAFIDIGGGSVGFQIGVTATDLILVFVDETTLKGLLGDRLKLGADASVAAGPVGRSAEAGVSGSLKAGIYSYSRSKGLFAGVALDGAVLSIDDEANAAVYGSGVTGAQVLEGKVKATRAVKPLVDALTRYAPARIAK